MTKMKTSLGLNSRIYLVDERICEFKVRSVDIFPRNKKKRKNEHNLRELQDIISFSVRKGERGRKNI
jgi:hypothetical protein